MMIATIAVLSLFASAVSACNCSHHVEQTQKVEPSCHSHSHQTNTVTEDTSSTSADAPCECLLLKTSPAIITKSEKEKTKLQKQITEPAAQAIDFELQNTAVAKTIAAASNDPSSYLSRHLAGLLRSRAPPRV